MSVQHSQPGLPDARLGSVQPPSQSWRATVSKGHEASAWQRAKTERLGDGPTPPRRFSWEATP